jgi:hypothetical protein
MCPYDPTSDMPDFVEWVSASGSGSFGPADYIHAQVLRGALSADMVGAIILWFWPTFTTHEGAVILMGTEEKYRSFLEQGMAPREGEYWCNFLNIDGMLPGYSVAFTSYVAEAVQNAWQSKLDSNFPELPYRVHLVNGPDSGEVSVTFCRAPKPRS